MGDPGRPQPQHGAQDLIQGSVIEAGAVGLRQGRAVRHPGDQRGVVAGPEPAGGEHVRHRHPGPPGHQGEVGLVLDLLQAIQDQGGPRIPVHAEPPHLREQPGVGRVPAIDRQLDPVARRVTAGELLHPPHLAGCQGNVPHRDVEVGDPLGDLRRRRQAQR